VTGNVLHIAFEYFWLLAIGTTLLGAVPNWLYAHLSERMEPERRRALKTICVGWAVAGNVPWLLMGIGQLAGDAPSALPFLRPVQGGFWVWLFWGVIIVLWAVSSWWIFAGSGAALLATARGRSCTVANVRLWFALSLAGGIIALFVLIAIDPLSRLPGVG
jgi:hypothetical protein